MPTINFILTIFCTALLLSCQDSEKKVTNNQNPQRPNIIFMMSDDHAYQAISAYNDELITTPNIDRIADEGILFTNASVTNSICAPSRAVILTGKHSHLNGKIDNLSDFDTTNVTFPQLLQEAGYQTAMFGKLHFGNNPKGFDKFMILPGQGDYYNPKFITQKGDTVINGYVTDIITDLTLNWLEKERDKGKPFLLMYLHKAPHRAWLPAERHYKEFTKKTFPLPETLFDDYVRIHPKDLKPESAELRSGHGNLTPPKNGISTAAKSAEMNILTHMILTNDNKLKDSVVKKLGIEERYLGDPTRGMNEQQKAAWDAVYNPINEEFTEKYPGMDSKDLMEWKYQRYMQDYLGTIAAVDENVGRVLNYLDENDLTENTIVVYTSDQGFYLGEHGWFDKRFMYDESFKTPLLIRWPNQIKEGITEEEMVQNLDFAQTFLEAAGVKAPDEMQGKSLIPLLKGENKAWDREAVYYHYYEYPAEHAVKRHYGIATKDYKLIHFYYDIDEWELYDRKNDPREMHNVFYDPDYAEVRQEMVQKLKEVREKYKDSEELDKQFIKVYEEK
ncbi:sulfatase [Salinimicrobium tongyeongense]|uniref:Sulfatase n=2 Tax=Salinimicrobium tongyeongense TaxID=2809707 RepID=A0ABY6NR96_9FLAO|nr:sulfatase [Salinimicrobium tongyeongense]UZH55429.1 sulfatase [Salinimicrobium tongyeongense]